jgi:hypothetical protein
MPGSETRRKMQYTLNVISSELILLNKTQHGSQDVSDVDVLPKYKSLFRN